MRLVIHTPRLKPTIAGLTVADYAIVSMWSGKPCHIVASTQAQAERTFEAAKSLLNGRDPKGTVPG